MRNLLGDGPAFIHSFAGKPWSDRWRLGPSTDLRGYIKRVYLDLSPYTLSAIKFRRELGSDTEWMGPHYVLSRILRALGMGCPALVGLPIAASVDLVRIIKYMQKSRRLNPSLLEPGGPEAASRR